MLLFLQRNMVHGFPLLFLLLLEGTCASISSHTRAHDDEISLSGIVGRDLVKEFEAIDKRLAEKTSSSEASENMKFLRELHHADKKNVFKIDRSKMLKAEKLLLALKHLTNEASCDGEGHEIIYQAHRALEGKPFISENVKCCHRRIDKIFLTYYRQHVITCQQVYPREMRRKLKHMDLLKVNRVGFFADNAISQFTTDNFVKNRSSPLAERLFYVISAEIDPQPRYIFNILKLLLRNQPEEKFLESFKNEPPDISIEKAFEAIFNNYLAEPCKYYIDQLGRDIFTPLSFSMELHTLNEDDVEFYKVWARFHFCRQFNKVVREKQRDVFKYAYHRAAQHTKEKWW